MPLIDFINYVASLSPAQRDAIRTISIAVGTGSVPLFGLILTWLARAIRRATGQTVQQTQSQDHVNGKLVTIPIAELMRRAMLNTEETLRNTRETKQNTETISHTTQELRGEFRSEITDLVNDPRTSPVARGRRRNPNAVTDQIPSHYIGDTDHE